MTKNEFLNRLRDSLKGYSEKEVDNSIEYYSEMIDDRIEDGVSEEDAVASLGDINEIIKSIKVNMPLKSVIKAKVSESKEKRGGSGLSASSIILIILFFPIWLPLLLVPISLIFAFMFVLWALDGVFFGVGAAGILSIVVRVVQAVTAAIALEPLAAVGALGAGLLGLGAGILLIVAGIAFAKSLARLFVGTMKGIKGIIIGNKRSK